MIITLNLTGRVAESNVFLDEYGKLKQIKLTPHKPSAVDEAPTKDSLFWAYSTDPSLTSIMEKSGGIATEKGGILCHAAVVAREYGIPAIIGVCGLTDTIPFARTATIALKDDGNGGTDGRTGVITVEVDTDGLLHAYKCSECDLPVRHIHCKHCKNVHFD